MMVETQQRLKEKTNEELLEMYRVEKSLEVKQELTLRYLYIVQTIAVQMRGIYAALSRWRISSTRGSLPL